MLETALKGSKKYLLLILILLGLHGIGATAFLYQLKKGLTITGMSRDVSWGLYIAQFTFLVGVAASAVMVVLPYYLHNVKEFGKITILGEFLAVASVSMCLMFIMVDLGKPMRMLNVILNPTPNSVLFWDMIVLNGYLFLNIVIGWVVLSAERKELPPPKWIKPFIYLSIPWAVSIHTVTAFLYAGLPGRHFWLTAIMAARFLASAFAAGPALLILLCLIVRKVSNFDPGKEAIQKVSKIVLYAMIVSIFFVVLELFTAFYSQIPWHTQAFVYQFVGLHGQGNLVPWTWAFAILAVIATLMLLVPGIRHNEKTLAVACALVFISLWIEKGITLVITGFIPNPLEKITQYAPTIPELTITVGVWATGFLILTILYKVAISVKEEIGA
jgi:Ni/Fe-hydrogenase subunit HybB-like protein